MQGLKSLETILLCTLAEVEGCLQDQTRSPWSVSSIMEPMPSHHLTKGNLPTPKWDQSPFCISMVHVMKCFYVPATTSLLTGFVLELHACGPEMVENKNIFLKFHFG